MDSPDKPIAPTPAHAVVPLPTFFEVEQLEDAELTRRLGTLAGRERVLLVALLLHLAEFDRRRLFAEMGYTSLFEYATKVLRFSEYAAYLRIGVARVIRRYPTILGRIANGTNHISAILKLGPFMTPDNHLGLLDQARGCSNRELERLVDSLRPESSGGNGRPAARLTYRRKDVDEAESSPAGSGNLFPSEHSPASARPPSGGDSIEIGAGAATPASRTPASISGASTESSTSPASPPVAFCRLHVTISVATADKLARVRELTRHSIPDGDPGRILDLALTHLLERVRSGSLAGAA